MDILLVEDDLEVGAVVALGLRHVGHGVEVVTTCAAAVTAIAARDWDAIIADIVLPGGDGLSLAAPARARGIAILFITGHPDRVAALREGPHAFVAKPFSPEALAAALSQLVNDSADGHA